MLAYSRHAINLSKPCIGSQINRTHPLAYGLIACFILNENTGNQIFDLVNHTSLPIVGATWGYDQDTYITNYISTYGLRFTSANQYAYATLPTWFRPQPPLTIVYQGTIVRNNGDYGGFFGIEYSQPRGSPYDAFALCGSVGQGPGRFDFNLGAGLIQTGGGGFTNLRRNFQMAGVLPAGPIGGTATSRYYLNGSLEDAHSLPSYSGSISYGTNPFIFFGDYDGTTSVVPGVVSDLGLIYNIALSEQNIQTLYKNPYGFILAPLHTRYFYQTAAPPVKVFKGDFVSGIRG